MTLPRTESLTEDWIKVFVPEKKAVNPNPQGSNNKRTIGNEVLNDNAKAATAKMPTETPTIKRPLPMSLVDAIQSAPMTEPKPVADIIQP